MLVCQPAVLKIPSRTPLYGALEMQAAVLPARGARRWRARCKRVCPHTPAGRRGNDAESARCAGADRHGGERRRAPWGADAGGEGNRRSGTGRVRGASTVEPRRQSANRSCATPQAQITVLAPFRETASPPAGATHRYNTQHVPLRPISHSPSTRLPSPDVVARPISCPPARPPPPPLASRAYLAL